MKFSEMPYARPDLDELKQQLQALTDQLKSAPDYASAHEAFLAQQKLSTHIDTLATLSSVRNSIDTRDKFYDCLLYTSPSPRDVEESRMPSSA